MEYNTTEVVHFFPVEKKKTKKKKYIEEHKLFITKKEPKKELKKIKTKGINNEGKRNDRKGKRGKKSHGIVSKDIRDKIEHVVKSEWKSQNGKPNFLKKYNARRNS